jgi:hypothetical protein
MNANRSGRSVTLQVSIWRRPDGHIRMIGKEGRKKVFMSTVTDKPNSKRRHAHLFRQLDELLLESDSLGTATLGK